MQKLLPNDIVLNETKGIGDFGTIERNVAWAIVKFCQKTNSWVEFTSSDLEAFILIRFIPYVLESMCARYGLLEKKNDAYVATEKFISALAKQTPP